MCDRIEYVRGNFNWAIITKIKELLLDQQNIPRTENDGRILDGVGDNRRRTAGFVVGAAAGGIRSGRRKR